MIDFYHIYRVFGFDNHGGNMRFLLIAKHWQVFLILVFGIFLHNFTIEGNPDLTTILNVIGGLIYFLWPMFIGHGLQEYLPRKETLNETFFLINGFIAITTILGIMIISNGKGMKFSGFEALPIVYVFYALLYFLAFPGRSLRTIELNKQVVLRDYIGDFFLIVCLPVGIWFLQPRLNRIVEEKEKEIDI